MSDTPLLHVYAQRSQHDEAYLIGNRLGLLQLQAALTYALHTGMASSVEVMVNDGETYALVVRRDDSPWVAGHPWERRAVPYTAESAKESNPAALWPWDQEPQHD